MSVLPGHSLWFAGQKIVCHYKSQPLCKLPANCWRQLTYRPQKIASYWALGSWVQRWHFKYQEVQNRHASTLHNRYVPEKVCIRWITFLIHERNWLNNEILEWPYYKKRKMFLTFTMYTAYCFINLDCCVLGLLKAARVTYNFGFPQRWWAFSWVTRSVVTF